MARSRNIKPGFFCNEILAEMDFATRLLFIGLWTEADRDGKLEDRPKKIKMALFPDDSVDVDSMLNVLHQGGLITRYSVGDIKVIKINAWAKHQSPHHTEKKSILPDNQQSQVNNASLTVKSQDQDGGNPPDSLLLIPDNLNTDSLNLIPSHANRVSVDSGEPTPASKEFINDLFGKFWQHYKYKQGKQAALKAFTKFMAKKPEGLCRFWMNLMLEYYMDCQQKEVLGYSNLHAATYINNKRWEDSPEFMTNFKAEWIAENGK